jgi:predicted RNA-binding Zn-ribbon protein involved in translation (DUF1610 family)
MNHSQKMPRVFGPRNTRSHKEIWGDLSISNPGLAAITEYLNSGEVGMKTICPHCGTTALVRSSRQMSKLVKHASCACLNVACGHTFIISVEAIRTISPPAFPDPEVATQLKQSERWLGINRHAGDSGAEHFAGEVKMP